MAAMPYIILSVGANVVQVPGHPTFDDPPLDPCGTFKNGPKKIVSLSSHHENIRCAECGTYYDRMKPHIAKEMNARLTRCPNCGEDNLNEGGSVRLNPLPPAPPAPAYVSPQVLPRTETQDSTIMCAGRT